MKRKIAGILVVTLLIASAVLPVMGMINVGNTKNVEKGSEFTNSLTSVSGNKCAFSGMGDNLDNSFTFTIPTFTVDVGTEGKLKFWTQCEIVSPDRSEIHYILDGAEAVVSGPAGSQPGWSMMEVNFGLGVGVHDMEIWFEYITGSDSLSKGWYVDSIIVSGGDDCFYTEDFEDYEVGESLGDWIIVEKPGPSDKEWIPFISSAQVGTPSDVKFKGSDNYGILVDSDIPGIYSVNISANNTIYQRLEIPYTGLTSEVGKPEVPIICKYLEVPYDVDLTVEVFYSDYITLDGYYVFPAQEPISVNETTEFVIDSEIYSTDEFYPSYNALFDEPMIMRGHRIIALTLFPVQFNPVTQQLRGYSKIEVRVRYNRPAQIEGIDERLESEAFESLLEAFILNYKPTDGFVTRMCTPALAPGADYLIITHDNYYTKVQKLADWKEKKGLRTKIVKTSDISPLTASGITSYIQNAYDTWNPAPTYVLLVGDADDIPPHYKTNHLYGGKIGTDLYYGTVDGGDIFPDIFMGRISVEDEFQVEDIVDKIIDYETDPPTGSPGFYNWVSLISYFQDDGVLIGVNKDQKEDGLQFVKTSEALLNHLDSLGYDVERIYTATYPPSGGYFPKWYDTGQLLPSALLPPFPWDGDAADITAAFNAGRFIINHRDHGYKTGWGHPWYDSIVHIPQLSNVDELPVVFSLDCECGWFDGETDHLTGNVECFCEELLRYKDGGAVANIGSTRMSWTPLNDYLNRGYFDAIWPGLESSRPKLAFYRLGQVLIHGILYLNERWNDVPPDYVGKYTIEQYHLFGDPEMSIWTSQPQPLTVTHPPKIGSSGPQKLVVKVADNVANPVLHALVCLRKGTDIHTFDYTDAGGYAIFDITPASGGNLDITVTKHNYIPSQGTIDVTYNGATIEVSPNTGSPSDSFTIKGSNFGSTEWVDIYFGSSHWAPMTTSTGGFTFIFPVPSEPPGPYNVFALGRVSGRAAVTVFYVFQPQSPDPYTYSQFDSSTWFLAGGNQVWDSPDIQLYDTLKGSYVPSNDLIRGRPYRIDATIRNDAVSDIPSTQVTFLRGNFGVPPLTQVIGEDIFVTVPGVPPGEVIVSTFWTPEITGHCCIQVEIFHPSDSNIGNNLGQENTDVHPIKSPAEVSFNVENPTNTTALVALEVIQSGGEEEAEELWGSIIERPYPQILSPGENQTATLTVYPPDDVKVGETRTFEITGTIEGKVIGGIQVRTVKLMELIKPKEGYLYIFDRGLIPIGTTLIIGSITVEVDADDMEDGIDRVEFYINNELESTDNSAPYIFAWDKIAFGTRTLKTVAYSNSGISAEEEIQVIKIL